LILVIDGAKLHIISLFRVIISDIFVFLQAKTGI